VENGRLVCCSRCAPPIRPGEFGSAPVHRGYADGAHLRQPLIPSLQDQQPPGPMPCRPKSRAKSAPAGCNTALCAPSPRRALKLQQNLGRRVIQINIFRRRIVTQMQHAQSCPWTGCASVSSFDACSIHDKPHHKKTSFSYNLYTIRKGIVE